MFVIDEDIYVEHFGVKGMRWGVRKDRTTAKEKSTESKASSNADRNKRIAIVLGTAATAIAVAAAVVYIKKHNNGIKLRDISKSSKGSKDFTETLAKEPVSMIHSSRGRERGYMFLRGGGLKDPEAEMIEAGLDKLAPGTYRFYGEGTGTNRKAALNFPDPEGRKDRSGRPILHQVIFPKSMAKDIYNYDQAKEEAWPMIKDISKALYEGKKGNYGPGF